MSSVAAQAGGLIGSSLIGLVGGERANSAAADRAKTQMGTEIELANTAHQREVNDLREAGLNPILSASGSGSSVPSVAPAPVINSLGEAMKHGITNYSAFQGAALQRQQIEASAASANLDKALSAKAAAETTSALSQAKNIEADTALKLAALPQKEFAGSAAKAVQPLVHSATDTISAGIQSVIDYLSQNSGVKVSKSSPNAPPKLTFEELEKAKSWQDEEKPRPWKYRRNPDGSETFY